MNAFTQMLVLMEGQMIAEYWASVYYFKWYMMGL